MRPLPVVSDGQRIWTGVELLLAGFGEDEAGAAGVRRYVPEPVVEEDSSWLVVDGGASHGACAKDSGGPLLSVVEGAGASVVGLLSAGSATCRGKDRYLRASSLTGWLDATMAAIEADPCNGIGAEGTCTDGQAKWCAGAVLESEICSDHRLCGWSEQVNGYRCLADGEDPCRGAGPAGTCDGNVLLRCDRGTLLETDCAACGRQCVSGPSRSRRVRVGGGRSRCGLSLGEPALVEATAEDAQPRRPVAVCLIDTNTATRSSKGLRMNPSGFAVPAAAWSRPSTLVPEGPRITIGSQTTAQAGSARSGAPRRSSACRTR